MFYLSKGSTRHGEYFVLLCETEKYMQPINLHVHVFFNWKKNTGIPDFAEVYSFIGSVFDPDTEGHMQKLKEMDPINFETVRYLKICLFSLFAISSR